MGIQIDCPACGHSMKLKAFLAGKRGICPKCKSSFDIPSDGNPVNDSASGTIATDPRPAAAQAAPRAATPTAQPVARPAQPAQAVARPAQAAAYPAQAAAYPAQPVAQAIPAAGNYPAAAPAGYGAAQARPVQAYPAQAPGTQPYGGQPYAAPGVAPTAQAMPTAIPTAVPTQPGMAAPVRATPVVASPAAYGAPVATPAGYPAAYGGMPVATPVQAVVAAPLDPLMEAPQAQWYIRPPSGGQFGPAAADLMRQWIQEGRVTADSLVWRDGWQDWKPASATFPQFMAATAQVAVAAEPASEFPISAPTKGFSGRPIHYRRGSGTGRIVAIIVLLIALAVLVPLLYWVLNTSP